MHQSTTDTEGNDDKGQRLWREGIFTDLVWSFAQDSSISEIKLMTSKETVAHFSLLQV